MKPERETLTSYQEVIDKQLAEIERLRAALKELLSGHDNLYIAHFGPQSDPHDDIAAKAARSIIEQLATEPLLKPATAATSFDASTPEGAKKARENADNYRKNLKPFA